MVDDELEGNLPFLHPDEGHGPGGPSLLPVYLQPRRIIDRVYGLVGGSRLSVSGPRMSRARRVLRTQHRVRAQNQPLPRSSPGEVSDNCGTSMKSDSKVESGDTIDQPFGLLNRRSNGGVQEREGGPEVEVDNSEVTSSILNEPSHPSPSLGREEAEASPSGNAAESFSRLQPVQHSHADPPSAPPLPCESHQSHQSQRQQNLASSTPPSARLLFSALTVASQTRTVDCTTPSLQWRGPGEIGNLHENEVNIGEEFMLARGPGHSRRRNSRSIPNNVRRSSLVSGVGGYSASHFRRPHRPSLLSSARRQQVSQGQAGESGGTRKAQEATTFLFPHRQPYPPVSAGNVAARTCSVLPRPAVSCFRIESSIVREGGIRAGLSHEHPSDGRVSNGFFGVGVPTGVEHGMGAGLRLGQACELRASREEDIRGIGRILNNDPVPQPASSSGQDLVPPSIPGRRNNHCIQHARRLPSEALRQGLNNVTTTMEDAVMMSNQDHAHNHAAHGGADGQRDPGRNLLGEEDIQPGESMGVSEDMTGKREEGVVVESSGVTNISHRMHDLELENKRLLSERDKYLQMYESEVLCQICWERKKNVLALPCSHYNYCQQCLEKHWEGKAERECPMCRQPVSSILCVKLGR